MGDIAPPRGWNRSRQTPLMGTQPFWGVSPVGRGILLWLLGVPIPIIIILALLFH